MIASTWLLVLLGAGAGFTSGLLGIGGGVIYVPALMYVLGIPIHLAIGVSLAVIVPSAAAGAAKHFFDGNVDLMMVLLIAPTSILGALLGAYIGAGLPADVLKKAFGVCLILIGANTVFGLSDRLRTESDKTASTEFSELIGDIQLRGPLAYDAEEQSDFDPEQLPTRISLDPDEETSTDSANGDDV